MIPRSKESASCLFVYGTLMRRFEHSMHEFLIQHTEYCCEGYYQGRLYRISWYPAVIPSGNPRDKVHGEVYRIRNESQLFPKLDEYEVCSPENPAAGEYVRKIAPIRTNDGGSIHCHIYLYNRSLHEARLIPTGRFESDILR